MSRWSAFDIVFAGIAIKGLVVFVFSETRGSSPANIHNVTVLSGGWRLIADVWGRFDKQLHRITKDAN